METNLFDSTGFKNLVKEAVSESLREHETAKTRNDVKLLSINAVCKILRRGHRTVSFLVRSGAIKSTPDGLIPETALNEYLGKV
jgi:hypothetical protein